MKGLGTVVNHETENVNVIRVNIKTGTKELMEHSIAKDTPISIYINGRHLVTILSTMHKVRELVIGFIIGEGILRSKEEIRELQIKEQKANIQTNIDVETRIKLYQTTKLITTACGSVETLPRLLDRIGQYKVKSQVKISPQSILQAISELNHRAVTPGMHGAAIFRDGELVSFAEDVGRHNAVDKVIGEALLLNVRLAQCILTSTGRQTSDMVLKCARVGISIIASIMGPLYSGIYTAEKTGITLICFVRGQQMNIYTCPERILLENV